MILEASNKPFVPFNQGSPLNLTQHDDIPIAAQKSISFFTDEDQTTPIEHIKDATNLCVIHHIAKENVAIIFLAASFKGKALQWFRSLLMNSINSWDCLGDELCKFFEDKSDHFSLVEQLNTIKRDPIV